MKSLRTSFLLIIPIVLIVLGALFFSKYRVSDVMIIPIEELTRQEYPEDPSDHSKVYGQYGKRYLKLVKKDGDLFDFVFESNDPKVATVTFEDIDLGLIVPVKPKWVNDDKDLEIITFVEREWNRQQMKFGRPSVHLEVSNGDGFEIENLFSAELSRNCLNAGLWELQLYTNEGGQKTLYYQGWFDFPLGHYKDIFERNNNISYWRHWNRLEHWRDPEGTPVNLTNLRKVISEKKVPIVRHASEEVIAEGEQSRKMELSGLGDIRCFGEFCGREDISFATFVPPGRYDIDVRWGNEFSLLKHIDKAIVRKVVSPGAYEALSEIEITFKDDNNQESRFIISGIDLGSLPALKEKEYPKGLYMPMGIAVPPFYQSYEELKRRPPQKSPYFSFLLDNKNRWLNHHRIGVDGPVIHRDERNSSKYHIYLLSYERQSVVAHLVIFI